MTLEEKIELAVETADTETASGLMFELAALAWDTNSAPENIDSLNSAGITWDDLRVRFSATDKRGETP